MNNWKHNYYSYQLGFSPSKWLRFISFLDSIILWCFGWKRYKRRLDIIWQDPLTPHSWFLQEDAIKIQTERFALNREVK